jgi:hypothetical protein
MHVIQNEVIINQFNVCKLNAAPFNFLLFDKCGYMALSCNYSMNKLYLYTQYGNFTGLS